MLSCCIPNAFSNSIQAIPAAPAGLAEQRRVLTVEEAAVVDRALWGGPMDEVLIDKFNVPFTREMLRCTLPRTWLNDEVINFYISFK